MDKPLQNLVQGIRQLIYPDVCVCCGILLSASSGPVSSDPLYPWHSHFCSTCHTKLTQDEHKTCPRCCSTVGEHANTENGCPRCQDETYGFDGAFRLGVYDGLLRDSIIRMKHRTGTTLAEQIGQLWASHLHTQFQQVGAQVIVPIPLHWWRQFRRGFNSPAILAQALAKRLGIPCSPSWLRRVRATASQTTLSPSARRTNVHQAFCASRSAELSDKTVLLIDDVLTTGSTAHNASRALRNAGAKRVIVAVLAHR